MRSYAFFNSVCTALGVGFLFGTLLVWRGSAAEAAVTNLVADVPVIEQPEISNRPPPAGGVPPKAEKSVINSQQSAISNQQLAISIPTRINLPVPFTSQAPERNWDQPWQDACEEAAALMLDAYYKKYNLSPLFARDEILKMVAWEDNRGWQYSIDIQKIKQIMGEYFGYDSKLPPPVGHCLGRGPATCGDGVPLASGRKLGGLQVIEDPTVEAIKQSVAAGHPVLAVAHGKDLPNPYFRGDGPEYHALIIRGYTEDSFITNDPGTWRGENFVYRYEDLMNAIHDWNDGAVKSGRQVVLSLTARQ